MPIEGRPRGPQFLFDTVTGRLWGYKSEDGSEIAFTFASSALAIFGNAPLLIGLGFPYSATFAAAGGTMPYSYSVVGSLPPGVALSAATGLLTGVTSAPGEYYFRIQATDAAAGTAVTPLFHVNVTGGRAALGLNGIPPTAATVGFPYVALFSGSGGVPPYSYALTGTLPAGLAFSTSTGAITGTPTTVQTATGLRVSVTDSAASAATALGSVFSIAVSATAPPPSDTRPRFGIGSATAGTASPAALLAAMTPLAGSSNGGKAGTFSLQTTSGNYGWYAAWATATSGGVVFTDATSAAGDWNGAGLSGANTGASPSPAASAVTFTDSNGYMWRLFRQDYPNANPSPSTWTAS